MCQIFSGATDCVEREGGYARLCYAWCSVMWLGLSICDAGGFYAQLRFLSYATIHTRMGTTTAPGSPLMLLFSAPPMLHLRQNSEHPYLEQKQLAVRTRHSLQAKRLRLWPWVRRYHPRRPHIQSTTTCFIIIHTRKEG